VSGQVAVEPSASARSAKRRVDRSPAYRALVRSGFVSRGITYAVIGGLALALALGAGTDNTAPNQQGALALIARSTLGRVALIAIAVGLLAYALWKLEQGIFSRGPEGAGGADLKERVVHIVGGLTYIGFFLVALRVLTGTASNSSSAPRRAAAGVLAWPAGPLLVALVGVIFIVITFVQIYEALSAKFLENIKDDEMNRQRRELFAALGRVGLTARALVFGLVGYFLVRTALDYSPRKAVGVDGALARLHNQPYGSWLVGAVALGLLVFAAYSLFEARYRTL
jgi:Domain of Unknown Function (DUF1206)